MRLANRVAVVTGASSGMGRATTELFAREGASVVAADIRAPSGPQSGWWDTGIDADIPEPHYVNCDVSVEGDVKQLMEATAGRHGTIDILVNCAGVSGRPLGDGPTGGVDLETFDKIIDVNLRGTFLVCREALPLLSTGQQVGASIVNISSVEALIGTPRPFDTHVYASSKAGVLGYTRSLAISLAPRNIRANAICPGCIVTPMNEEALRDDGVRNAVEDLTPLPFLGLPEDIAQAALFLGSGASRFVTGVALTVDGGWSAH